MPNVIIDLFASVLRRRRRGRGRTSVWLALLTIVGLAAGLAGCSNQIAKADQKKLGEPKVEVFFNSTGTRQGNQADLKPSEFLVERIDAAEKSLDLAVYGFEKQNVIDAVIRAYERGVDVRFVGSTSHIHAEGYRAIMEREIPSQVGNEYSIMHQKYFIIDGRFVFSGTGNITPTGFGRNNNNWVWIESIPVAKDYTQEFERMFNGRYSTAKDKTAAETTGGNLPGPPNTREGKNTYQVGDTKVELYFSPQEPAMTRILQEVRAADTSIHFQIFAFTKNELGSAFINKHREFMKKNANAGLESGWRKRSPRTWPNKITGILDRSQVHGNGQWHEAYRLHAFGVPMKIDANEASIQPGDYQAGGGRLHTKTMVLDAGTEDARVITGSFNWSSSAAVGNDEVVMVLHGQKIANRYMSMFDSLWNKSRWLEGGLCNYLRAKHKDNVNLKCASRVDTGKTSADPGDVVFSEVHWDGWNGRQDPTEHTGPVDQRAAVVNDEFIELYNTTDRPIDLSLWTITNGHDFVMGFPPGTIIRPNSHYLILDHNSGTYSDSRPQRGRHAFLNPNFVLNTVNDPRYPRLNIKNSSLHLELRKMGSKPSEPAVDIAGDWGPPFAGGRALTCQEKKCLERGQVSTTVGCNESCPRGFESEKSLKISGNYSMERKIPENGNVPKGNKAGSWQACQHDKGGENVNPDFRDRIIATPGEANSN
ncbi:MAG: phospholipase D-like domain-containing protein [Bradymonadaceae bacterium]